MTPAPKGARLAKANRAHPLRPKAAIADFDRFNRLAEGSLASPRRGKGGGAARESMLPGAEAPHRPITIDPCPQVGGKERP